jgi:hypothetical protein
VSRDHCLECGEPILRRNRPKSAFCSEKCSHRARDRRKYEADPEAARAKSRAYYAKNRERVIARVQRRRREKDTDAAA